MEIFQNIVGYIFEHFTMAEIVIISLLFEAAMVLFALKLIMRLALWCKIISKERFDRAVEKKRGKKWVGAVYGGLGLISIIGMGFGFHWQSGDETKTWHQGNIGAMAATVNHKAEAFIVDKDVRDLCLGIIKGDQTYSACFTHAQAKNASQADDSTIFEIGSISKTFTYASMLKVLEKHNIDLDSEIGPHLPADVRSKNPALAQVTFKQLATHTSGLSRVPYDYNWTTVGSIFKTLVMGNPYSDMDKDYVYDYLTNTKLQIGGTKEANYSNLGVGLLGLLISEMEGLSYQQLIEREITSPLKMAATTAGPAQNQNKATAGYGQFRTLGPIVIAAESDNWAFDDALAGAGAITSSVSDMLVYLEHSMNAFKHPRYQNASNIKSFGEQSKVNLGWVVTDFEAQPQSNYVYHDGGTGGFRSFLGFDESSKVGVVILSNGTRFVNRLGEQILHQLVEEKTVVAQVFE